MADPFDALALGIAKKYELPADAFLRLAKQQRQVEPPEPQQVAPQLDVQPKAPRVPVPKVELPDFGPDPAGVPEAPRVSLASRVLAGEFAVNTPKVRPGKPPAAPQRGVTVAPQPGAPVTPGVLPSRPSADFSKWVRVPPPRGSSSKPHQPAILSFVGSIAQGYGKPLAVWDNTTHSRTTVNGNESAHYRGNAADIPARGAQLKRLGYIALVKAGMNPAAARNASRKGGLFNVGGYQVIFATNVGGNHYDHVHVGIRG
jgi:hypothetical protein